MVAADQVDEKWGGFLNVTQAALGHLLSTPANAARLARGLKEAEEGKVLVKKLKL